MNGTFVDFPPFESLINSILGPLANLAIHPWSKLPVESRLGELPLLGNDEMNHHRPLD